MPRQPVEVQAFSTKDASADVGDCNYSCAKLLQCTCCCSADRTVTLYRHVGASQIHPSTGGSFLDAICHALASCILAALGAAESDRLSGDDTRHGVAPVHRVGIHHPGHHLRI